VGNKQHNNITPTDWLYWWFYVALNNIYVLRSLSRGLDIFVQFLIESEFSWDFCHGSDIKFHENPVGAELIHADRWTDMTKFTATSHDYSSASKMP